MGIKIGCPSLKLTHKLAAKANTKRTGRMVPVLAEAWEPRWSRDPDVDHSKTPNNEYLTGPKNAFALAALIDADAQAYSEAKRAAGGRGLRNTASTGWAIVLKPPADYMNGLTQAEQDRFIHDLYDSFRAVSRDFMAEDAIKGAVYQKDEQGAHIHIAGSSKLPDGTICTDKIICPRFWDALNVKIPAEMRQKGWEVDACQNYDPEKAQKMTETEKAAYIAECKAKRPKIRGVSSERYKTYQEIERLQAELERLKTPVKAPEAAREAPRPSQVQKPKEPPRTPPEAPQKPSEKPQTREEIQAEFKARMERILQRVKTETEEEQPAPKQAPAAPPAPAPVAPTPRPSAPPAPEPEAPTARPLPRNAPSLPPTIEAPERNNNFSL